MKSRPVPHLDHAGLRRVLEARRGARIVSIVTVTVPAMRKTDNPFYGLVERVVRRNGICGASYASSVNRRRVKEGRPTADDGSVLPFASLPLPWGRHDGPFFVSHLPKGAAEERLYLKFLPTRNGEEQWRNAITKRPYEAEQLAAIKTFLRERSESSRQQIENQVEWRTIALDSIEQIQIDGELYLIDHPQPQILAAAA